MTLKTWRFVLLLALMPLALLTLGGCNKEAPKAEGPKGKPTQVAEKASKEGHDHSGWWCDEHGVPEEVCGQCNVKIAAEFKKKGDWCKEHDRPDSQCFVCHPELKERFAAQYRAKYGKEPPPTEDEEKAKKDESQKGSKK
jgi:hypothetical protein